MDTFVISGIALGMALIAFVIFRSRNRVKADTQVSDGDNSSFAHTDSYSSSNNCSSSDTSAADTSHGLENCSSAADSDSTENDLACDNESDSGSDSGGDSGSSSSD